MSEVLEATLQKAFKPFDVVTNSDGAVGLIQEVSVNDCQVGFDDQISYSVSWIVGNENKCAWWTHEELNSHCNLFVKIAEMSVQDRGLNERWVQPLFGSMKIAPMGETW